jgi:diaminohydroxyphosphoribosylaminopyrimidine deaminase/5-amino-6-(5-phosphoribosylamino)uracil reductase
MLRAQHDAVLIGSGTALSDDPRLDVRLPGMENSNPLRVVLDRRLRLLLDSDLVQRAHSQPTFVITAEHPNAMKRRELTNRNVLVRPLTSTDPASVLGLLGRAGITRVLIEGGAMVATSFLSAGLVDRIAWFRAPIVIGNDGWPGAGPLGIQQLSLAQRFRRTAVEEIGDDLLESYGRQP